MRPQNLGNAVRVEVEGARLDIGENRNRAHTRYRARGGEEGVRRGENLVAMTDIEGHQRKGQRIGPGGAANAKLGGRIRRDFSLELLDILAQNELLRVHHADDFRQNLFTNLLVLCPQIQQGICFSLTVVTTFLLFSLGCRADLLSGLDVLRAASLAFAVVCDKFQRNAACAHPAVLPGRVSIDQGVIGDISRYDRACAHEGVPPNGSSTNNRAVGANGCALSNQRGLIFVFSGHMTSRIHYVGEHHGRPAEHIVFQDTTGIDRNVVLDLHVVADDYVRRNDDILPNVAVRADARILHDMREMPDFRAGTDSTRLVDVTRFVNEIILFFHYFHCQPGLDIYLM